MAETEDSNPKIEEPSDILTTSKFKSSKNSRNQRFYNFDGENYSGRNKNIGLLLSSFIVASGITYVLLKKYNPKFIQLPNGKADLNKLWIWTFFLGLLGPSSVLCWLLYKSK